MCGLKVRFSQSPEHRSVFNYALKVEVLSSTGGIPTKIFVYHQSPAGIDGNTFAEFDHVATPVDLQEIPEDAASETVPWYRTNKVVVWFRNVSDLNLAKQMFVDDILALKRTFRTLTSENNFTNQTDVEFSDDGVHEKGIRSVVKSLGSALGATIVKSIALALGLYALSANGAGFSGEYWNQIDWDENPMVVTNVSFEGVATETAVSNLEAIVSSNTAKIATNTANIATNTSAISAIEAKIPAEATAQNQLADKEFVTSSIAMNVATFRGTYNLVSDLRLTVDATHEATAEAIAEYLSTLQPPVEPENNDYVFVQVPREPSDPTVIAHVDCYKCSGSGSTATWEYAWSFDNSSFTAAQWDAINSGITSDLVSKLSNLPTADELAAALLGKADKVANATSGNFAGLDANGNLTDSGKKAADFAPASNIQKSALASDVQTSLGNADTAIQTVKVNGSALTPDENKAVDVEIPPTPVSSVNNKTGAVELSASDVGALPNSGNLVLNGSLTASNYLAAVQLIVGSSSNGLIFSQDDQFVYATVKSDGYTVATYKFPKDFTLANDNGSIARWIDIIRAVQQIAPAWSIDTSYAQNALVSYSGVVYRKKSSGTSTTNFPTGDPINWEAKKVSELFVPWIDGNIWLDSSKCVSVGGDDAGSTKYKYGEIDHDSGNIVKIPSKSGTIALLQNIATNFSTSATYAVNDLCVFDRKLYRCTTAITTAEAWTAEHWTEATVEDVLAAIRSALALKAPLASPALTGTPTAPDIEQNAPDGQIANKKYVAEQLDTESPLVARSFTTTGTTTDNYNGTVMYFRSRFFGMNDGDRFKGFIIRTRVNGTAIPTLYARLRRYSDNAVLAISNAQSWPSTSQTDVPFSFPVSVVLPSKDNYYYIDFVTENSTTATAVQIGLRVYNYSPATNPDCYFGSSSAVPVLTAQFYSFASDLQTTGNLVTSVSASSTDEQYPSAKCVYDNISPLADRDYVIISSDQTVVAATNSQMITSYATGNNDLQNGTGSGSAYSGFIMNLKEYATLALENQGISNIAVKTVSLQQIMVRISNYSTALKMYVYDYATGEQLMESNSTGTADNDKRARTFVFPTSPMLEADKQYKFVIVQEDGTAVGSGIRLYDSILIPVPSYQWIGISGTATSVPNMVFQGTITFAYEGQMGIDLMTRRQCIDLCGEVRGEMQNLADEVTTKVNKIEEIDWVSLKSLKDEGLLITGSEYRITNYWATSNGDMNSRAVTNQFDIIVVADATNVLNETARAIRHEGDTYFPSATKFEAWRLQYSLNNDANRFAWAVSDADGGKGVIYRMIDEFENDVPYDFKGIQFQRWAINGVSSTKLTPEILISYTNQFVYAKNGSKCFASESSDIDINGTVFAVDSSTSAYYYTFDTGNSGDNSLMGEIDYNKIGEYRDGKNKLNSIVFFGSPCYSNTFGNNCHHNTFGHSCYSNTFGHSCYSNTFGNYYQSNTFGNYCYDNTFGHGCGSNTFGNNCHHNTFGNSYYSISGNNCNNNTFGSGNSNTFGNDCNNNTFGNNCNNNTFGNYCNNNTFGNYCNNNTFGNSCRFNTFGNNSGAMSYYRYITIESGNQHIYLYAPNASSSAYYQNVEIKSGVNNTSSYKTITDSNTQQTFHTTYQPTNSQVIEM